jgi:hypothetical protein
MDIAKTDLTLQFILLLAGQEDHFADRQLGPIHLIKYVYLADLAFAKSHGGQTFTGADWTFYKFGPWSQSVNERIAPALKALNADATVFESAYEDRDEWVRWSKADNDRLDSLERQVPFEIRVGLRSLVHRFGKHTPSLLDFVYGTEPMLVAAPGDKLRFAVAPVATGEPHPTYPAMTERKRKKFREAMNALRSRSRESTARLVRPPAPRFDEVYRAGMAWLEELAGPVLPEGTLTAEFDRDVWYSTARKGADVP